MQKEIDMPLNLCSPSSFFPDVNGYARLDSMQSVDQAAASAIDAASAHAGSTAQTTTCSRLLKQSADALSVTASFIKNNAAPLVSGVLFAASATGMGIGVYGTFNPQSGPLARYASVNPYFGKYENGVAFNIFMGSALVAITSGAALVASLTHNPQHLQTRADQVAVIEMQSLEQGTGNTSAATHSTSVGTQTDHVTVDIQALSPSTADDNHVVLTIRPENPSSSEETAKRAA